MFRKSKHSYCDDHELPSEDKEMVNILGLKLDLKFKEEDKGMTIAWGNKDVWKLSRSLKTL